MVKRGFIGCCIYLPVHLLNPMIEKNRQITRKTFLRYIDKEQLRDIEETWLKYTRKSPMSKDWHVTYHKSMWGENPCVYFRHSAIEYIFV